MGDAYDDYCARIDDGEGADIEVGPMTDLDGLREDVLDALFVYEHKTATPGRYLVYADRAARLARRLKRVLALRDERPSTLRSFGKDDDAFRAGWAKAIEALDRALRGGGGNE